MERDAHHRRKRAISTNLFPTTADHYKEISLHYLLTFKNVVTVNCRLLFSKEIKLLMYFTFVCGMKFDKTSGHTHGTVTIRACLHQDSASTQSQPCDDTSDTALIENNERMRMQPILERLPSFQ